MPSPILHLGPALALGLIFKKRINLIAILLSTILIDIRIGYLMLATGRYLHGPLHTLLGATFVGVVLTILIYLLRDQLGKINDFFGLDRDYSLKAILTGSLLGAWIHVVLDGLIYPRGILLWTDMAPLIAWTVHPHVINGVCILGFIVAGYVYYKRTRKEID